MRTLGGATSTEISAPITRPGYLLEIGFPTPLRVSSRSTVNWNSADWTAWDFSISGLNIDSTQVGSSGTISLGNTDLSISTYILNWGVSGRSIKVWKFYGDATALADPVQIFDGIGDAATVTDAGKVSVTVQQAGTRTLYGPRTYITPDAGFHWLPPQGQKITWNDETIVLNPDGI